MAVRIICDVGGTSLRLGLVVENAVVFSQETACNEWSGLVPALRAFMALPEVSVHGAKAELVLAVAAPVGLNNMVRLTNRSWQFSSQTLMQSCGFSRVAILNDFEALALSLPHFSETDLEVLQPGHAHDDAPRLVMGAGTGFGMAGMVPLARGGWRAVAAEGGHASLCADVPEYQGILGILQKKSGRVEMEQVFSGPGLVRLAQAMGMLREEPDVPATPEDMLAGLRDGNGFCRDVLHVFAGWLGRMCGDMALVWGARGGIYLAGGLLQALGAPWFRDSVFLESLCAKGRFAGYLEAVPVHLITRQMPAFPGLVHYRFPAD